MTAATQDELDHDEFEAQCHDGIRAWVAEHFGGEVEEITRLERWRPQWKVTYTAKGETRSVLFRGNRPVAPIAQLQLEMQAMQVLAANGIKIPTIHGWVDEPTAFVMDWIDTEDRAPGLLHTAMDHPPSMSAERWQAMLGYMDELARVHAVPVSEFAHITRLSEPPTTAQDLAMHATERMYQLAKMFTSVDSSLEFIQRWLWRNHPQDRESVHFVCGDAGQFMSAGPEVVALLDFEIANLGDTHWDLACFRGRHPHEDMGDIPALYERYAEASGTDVDLEVVCYYTVSFLQLAVLGAQFFMLPEIRGADWIEGILETASITRRALEGIAELDDIELDHDLRLPEPGPESFETSGLRKLMVDIGRLPTGSSFAPWERKLMGSIPEMLLNYNRYRSWFERETTADISAALGETFDDLAAADAALLEAIAADDPADDTKFVQLMHRRSLRFSMILVDSDPDEDSTFFYILEPILDR